MTGLDWKILGELEVAYNQDKNDFKAAFAYLTHISKFEELKEVFLDLANEVFQKFPDKFKLTSFLAGYFKLLGNEKTSMEYMVKSVELEPESETDLRNKMLIMRELNLESKAIPEIESFEAKHGVSSQTLVMRGDFFAYKNDLETVSSIRDQINNLPDDSPDKLPASSYLSIILAKKNKDEWNVAQILILESLKKSPINNFTYNVLFYGCKLFSPTPDLMRDILDISLTSDQDILIYTGLLRVFIDYAIFFPNARIFRKLESLSGDIDSPIISLLESLCLYFDNYGLARSVVNNWLNPQVSESPDFIKTISQIAQGLSQSATTGMGLGPPKGHSAELTREELIKKLDEIAIESLRQYTNIHSYNPDSHLQLGILLSNSDKEGAKIHLKRALELRPNLIPAKFYLAKILDSESNDIEAYELYKEISESKPENPELSVDSMIRASEIAIKFGWIEEGEEFLEKAIGVMPYDNRVIILLAKVYLKEAKIIGSDYALNMAIDFLKQSLAVSPDNLESFFFLGTALYLKKEFLSAIRMFTRTFTTQCKFKTQSAFWISRCYYQLYKNLLFSKIDFLHKSIEYANYLKNIGKEVPLALEYIAHLYDEANDKATADSIRAEIPKEQHPCPKPKLGTPGEANILAVYSPQIVRREGDGAPEKLFSRGSLAKIEVSYVQGKGDLKITGNLGESYLNSVHVAYTFFKRYLESKGLSQHPAKDIHIDVPGWYPKFDGPSAGLSIACAMISAYTNKPLPINATMTGEISSMGKVLPVGGIKEKIEATYNKGIDCIFIPMDNKWDYLDMLLKDDPSKMAKSCNGHLPNIIFVDAIEQVLETISSHI